jgi:hypothetical protein
MALKPESLRVGEVVFDVHRERAGNTMMTRLGWWTVKIIELRDGGAVVSWNGNKPEFRSNHSLRRYRRKLPAKLDPDGTTTRRYQSATPPTPKEPGSRESEKP